MGLMMRKSIHRRINRCLAAYRSSVLYKSAAGLPAFVVLALAVRIMQQSGVALAFMGSHPYEQSHSSAVNSIKTNSIEFPGDHAVNIAYSSLQARLYSSCTSIGGEWLPATLARKCSYRYRVKNQEKILLFTTKAILPYTTSRTVF